MHFYSTNRRSAPASFREAVLGGQPDDGGLYFPAEIPQLPSSLIERMASIPLVDVALEVIRPYVGGDIPDDRLRQIVDETLSFPLPLVALSERISALELFHGPTLAFKDIGAGFMSRCLRYFGGGSGRRTFVIVATSGDTGGAVAAGFHGLEGIEVIILFPKGKVSRVQELQLTTFGGNVTTLEVRGTFDDCQAIAKQMLADAELNARAHLTSANSINVARWLPQQFYYFAALQQWQGAPPVISVPSGNFGNLAAGMLAARSGLPVSRFIAACNANDVVPRFMNSGSYDPRPAVATISNAMDVGSPSNLVRISEIFGGDREQLSSAMAAKSYSDEETRRTMVDVYSHCKYILDPHGAVGYLAIDEYLSANGGRGIFLATAHPVKFDVVLDVIGTQGNEPESLADLAHKPKQSVEIDNDPSAVRDMILAKL